MKGQGSWFHASGVVIAIVAVALLSALRPAREQAAPELQGSTLVKTQESLKGATHTQKRSIASVKAGENEPLLGLMKADEKFGRAYADLGDDLTGQTLKTLFYLNQERLQNPERQVQHTALVTRMKSAPAATLDLALEGLRRLPSGPEHAIDRAGLLSLMGIVGSRDPQVSEAAVRELQSLEIPARPKMADLPLARSSEAVADTPLTTEFSVVWTVLLKQADQTDQSLTAAFGDLLDHQSDTTLRRNLYGQAVGLRPEIKMAFDELLRTRGLTL